MNNKIADPAKAILPDFRKQIFIYLREKIKSILIIDLFKHLVR